MACCQSVPNGVRGNEILCPLEGPLEKNVDNIIYYYHFCSIYETGQKFISHTKMGYLNLEKNRSKKIDKYI